MKRKDNELYLCLCMAAGMGCTVRRVEWMFIVSHPHFHHVLVINAHQNAIPPSLDKWLDELIDKFI